MSRDYSEDLLIQRSTAEAFRDGTGLEACDRLLPKLMSGETEV